MTLLATLFLNAVLLVGLFFSIYVATRLVAEAGRPTCPGGGQSGHSAALPWSSAS
ncbi:MAG: hypothetical protein IPK12_01980 [Gemmatimonadetes bacterium]|nr:hypothetical protein [Gemmatimonadota bacterium]